MQQDSLNIYMLIIGGMVFSFLTGIAVILFYTRYHRRLAEQQEKIRGAELQHQKDLLHAVIQSQENERKRIGQDLHDDVGSTLSKLRMLFNQKIPAVTYEEVETDHKKLNFLIDRAIENVRNISHRLSPATLEFFGFADAMEELCNTARDSSGIDISIDNQTGEKLNSVPYLISLHLFRVFEELITNTLKHADARQIIISFLNEENSFVCIYHDDGKGFDIKQGKPGIGLHNISSRISMIGGAFTINSSPGNGVTVRISAPLNHFMQKNISNGENQDSDRG